MQTMNLSTYLEQPYVDVDRACPKKRKTALTAMCEHDVPVIIPVHNHGLVRLVDFMGGDAAVVQSARVSYGEGTKSVREDRHLIEFLFNNEHMTPFEHVVLKFHIKTPMFVARQFHRHRTSSINEVSARYSEVKDEFYLPEPIFGISYDELTAGEGVVALRGQAKKNRQGSDGLVEIPEGAWHDFVEAQQNSFKAYQVLLEAGVSRELARACLPVGTYTEWYWTMNLRNLIHFLQLRCDSHSQEEARDYAKAMLQFARLVAPISLGVVKTLKDVV
jgi:thymidylate synthase (FAD)